MPVGGSRLPSLQHSVRYVWETKRKPRELTALFAFFFTSFRALLVLSRGFGTGKCAFRVFLLEVSLDFFHLLLPNIINLWYKH